MTGQAVLAVCRVRPDGGRPVADRGIGGTGAPAQIAGSQIADRGIGGTGIIGVITGFASVCVAGQEVALPDGVPTRIDDIGARLDDLRAGQVVTMDASGEPGSLQARQIDVRHAVIGPIETVGTGTITVAGQMVFTADLAGIAAPFKPGQWVAVSGLREGGNLIAATRIDPASPGRVLVRGELIRLYGETRVGSLTVRLPSRFDLPAGFPVTLTGRLQNGVLVVDGAARDVASESPSAYFGPTVSSYIVEGYVAVLAGGYLVNRDFVSGIAPGRVGTVGRAIAQFTHGQSGLVSTGLIRGAAPDAEPGGPPGGRTLAPASPGSGFNRGRSPAGMPDFAPAGGSASLPGASSLGPAGFGPGGVGPTIPFGGGPGRR